MKQTMITSHHTKSWSLYFLFITCLMAAPNATRAESPLGINLPAVKDYSDSIPFVDLFKTARVWIPLNADGSGPWDTKVTVPMNSDGYPLEIPYNNGVNPPQNVITIIGCGAVNNVTGTFTLIYEGDGDLKVTSFRNNSRLTFTAAGTYPITYTLPDDYVHIQILRSNRNNPVRNIRFILPGFQSTYMTQPFHPKFLENLRPFSFLRFMGWEEVNESKMQSWAERATPTYFSEATPRGGSIENQVLLANTLDKDLWVCIPHLADDNYVQQFAQVIKNNLKPDRKVYVEYSNEVWNWSFAQRKYADDMGKQLGLPYPEHLPFLAKRSAEIFAIFDDVFGAQKSRVVKVLAYQAAADANVDIKYLATYRLIEYFNSSSINNVSINPRGIKLDSLAIAPYFGYAIADNLVKEGKISATPGAPVSVTVNEVLDRCDKAIDDETLVWSEKNAEVAKHFGVKLIAYEGGQHLRGNLGNENIEALTNLMIEANRHPRMYDLYRKYFNVWFSKSSGEFAAFVNVSRYNKFGMWGSLEYEYQPVSDAPKYRALRDVIGNVSYTPPPVPPTPAPSPITDEQPAPDVNVINSSQNGYVDFSCNNNIKIISRHGTLVRELPCQGGSVSWDKRNSSGQYVASGVYMVKEEKKPTRKVVIIK